MQRYFKVKMKGQPEFKPKGLTRVKTQELSQIKKKISPITYNLHSD
jgi:hypothetical protein